MIPYWEPGPIHITNGVEFHVFGILVGIGVLSGHWLAQKRSEQVGLSPVVTADMALWIVVVAFLFAHWVSILAYFPERLWGTPCETGADCPAPWSQGDVAFICGDNGRCNDGRWWRFFEIWNGISSFGGFLGAGVALWMFFKLKRIVIIPKVLELVGGKGRPMLKYLDVIAYGFSIGWFFGRLGCFSAHDHVGRPTNSFLGVNFPDGWRSSVPAVQEFGESGFTPRFDLGLMEVFFSLGMFLFFHFWANKQKDLRPGFYASVFILVYAPYRFFLDTLRATDIGGADRRYFADIIDPGLTPGQMGAVLVALLGVWIWVVGGKRAKDPEYMSGSKFTGTGWAEGGSKEDADKVKEKDRKQRQGKDKKK